MHLSLRKRALLPVPSERVPPPGGPGRHSQTLQHSVLWQERGGGGHEVTVTVVSWVDLERGGSVPVQSQGSRTETVGGLYPIGGLLPRTVNTLYYRG